MQFIFSMAIHLTVHLVWSELPSSPKGATLCMGRLFVVGNSAHSVFRKNLLL